MCTPNGPVFDEVAGLRESLRILHLDKVRTGHTLYWALETGIIVTEGCSIGCWFGSSGGGW